MCKKDSVPTRGYIRCFGNEPEGDVAIDGSYFINGIPWRIKQRRNSHGLMTRLLNNEENAMDNIEKKMTGSPSAMDGGYPRLSARMTAVGRFIQELSLFLMLMSCWPMLGGQALLGDELDRCWALIQAFFYRLIAEMETDMKWLFGEKDGGLNGEVDEVVLAFACQWCLDGNMNLVGFEGMEAGRLSMSSFQDTDIGSERMPSFK